MARYHNEPVNIEDELKLHTEEFYKNIGTHKTNKTTLISDSRWNAILNIYKHKLEGISKRDFKYLQSQTKYNQSYSWVKVYNLFTCGVSELVVYKTAVDTD